MYASHIIINRDLLDHFPKDEYYDFYKSLLSKIPDEQVDDIREQLFNSELKFYCKCGCHSFFINPDESKVFKKLQDHSGLLMEIAYATNYDEELNVMLFNDDEGQLRQATVYFGQHNLKPIPEDIKVKDIIGIWRGVVDKDLIKKNIINDNLDLN